MSKFDQVKGLSYATYSRNNVEPVLFNSNSTMVFSNDEDLLKRNLKSAFAAGNFSIKKIETQKDWEDLVNFVVWTQNKKMPKIEIC